MAGLSEKPGDRIGRYKLLQQIGEGGMGTVYMAEQTHPVQRKVALKLIKSGMDSKLVLARFAAERRELVLHLGTPVVCVIAHPARVNQFVR